MGEKIRLDATSEMFQYLEECPRDPLILDVGCGGVPRGDVNIDLWIGYTPHTRGWINPERTKNFIKADAHHLPFRDQSFDLAISYHVLEHLENPLKTLKELRRISKEVIIRVPLNQFYLYVIEAIGILHTFLAIPFLKTMEYFKKQIHAVRIWKKRYQVHQWYVKLEDYSERRVGKKYFFIPFEVLYIFKSPQF